MNKLYKSFLVFIIAMVIIPINSTLADINTKSIVIGNDNKFTNKNDSFVLIDTKELMPGDYIEETLEIKNLSKANFYIKTNSEEITTKEDDIYLLDKLNITILCEDNVLFKGKASDINIIKDTYAELGEIVSGEAKTIKIIAELDGSSVGNEFQNKSGAFKMNFYISEKYDDVSNSFNSPNIGNFPNEDKLPSTGGQNTIYVILIAVIIIFAGYKFIKK